MLPSSTSVILSAGLVAHCFGPNQSRDKKNSVAEKPIKKNVFCFVFFVEVLVFSREANCFHSALVEILSTLCRILPGEPSKEGILFFVLFCFFLDVLERIHTFRAINRNMCFADIYRDAQN